MFVPRNPWVMAADRAPVSQIESFVSEQAYVLLRHPGFSAGGVVLSRAIFCRISRNSFGRDEELQKGDANETAVVG
jgi:hypothetical protein